MAARKSTLIKRLKGKFPTIVIFDHDEFGFSAEDGSTDDKNWPLADYYDASYRDPEERYYQFGISRRLLDFIAPLGWETQWINPGMVGLYKD